MTKPLVLLTLAVLLTACNKDTPPAPPPASAAAAPATTVASAPAPIPLGTDQQIDAAMQRAADFLLTVARAPAGFEIAQPDPDLLGAQTSLAVDSLALAGNFIDNLGPRSSSLAPLYTWIKAHPAPSPTVVALRTAALLHLPPDRERRALFDAAAPLVNAVLKPPARMAPSTDPWQIAHTLLAADGFQHAGIETPHALWATLDQLARKSQTIGEWKDPTGNATPLTSSLGALSLLIAREELDTAARLAPQPDRELDAALIPFNAHIRKLAANPTPADFETFYYAQQVCDRLGSDLLFTRAFAAKILSLQSPNGSFPPAKFDLNPNAPSSVTTSYALALLANIRRPIAFQRLDIAPAARPSDVAHLTRWLADKFERPLRWRSIAFDAPLDDWTRVPILIVTASDDPHFTPAQLQRLADYIHAGGTVLSIAEGDKPQATAAFTKAVSQALGQSYEMRELTKDHPVFSEWTRIIHPFPVRSVSNGIREMWIHVPSDISAIWQDRRMANRESWELPANLLRHVAPITLRAPEAVIAPVAFPAAPAKPLTIARVTFVGNWDPEPGAWTAFAKANGFTAKIAPIAPLGVNVRLAPLAHLTGTGAVNLKPTEVRALLAYVDAGGTLIVDAAGGSVQTQRFIADAFLPLLPQPLPAPIALQPADLRRHSRTAKVPVDIYDIPLAKAASSSPPATSPLDSSTSRPPPSTASPLPKPAKSSRTPSAKPFPSDRKNKPGSVTTASRSPAGFST